MPCLAAFMSSLTIMTIAVDRHRAICRPTLKQVYISISPLSCKILSSLSMSAWVCKLLACVSRHPPALSDLLSPSDHQVQSPDHWNNSGENNQIIIKSLNSRFCRDLTWMRQNCCLWRSVLRLRWKYLIFSKNILWYLIRNHCLKSFIWSFIYYFSFFELIFSYL